MDMGEMNEMEIGTDLNMPNQQQLKTSSSAKSNNNRHEEGEGTSKMAEGKQLQSYECNICLDVAKDAVVSFCGHLFCWPCLHQWFCKCRPKMPQCPVCRTAISEDKVVPIYGHGDKDNNAAAMDQGVDQQKIPPRPSGSMGNRNESVQKCIDSLMHACTCTDLDCGRGTCRKMKKVISHTKQCRKRLQENAECALCKQMLALLCYHARNCAEHECKVPFCPQIKQKLATQ